ncbi:hypothetical protein SAMN04487968_105189 [Nocardioides terrae]|uniref:Chemotaxis protein CheX n=1 Tax=Nocardioides terrae TaxID=574651 RepID=A0A1I1I8A0_9ACTN|nr:hypothetical protein [Nocardioides terrae]SFC32649.1 hypothetical protein SAMN04487968_105189 [Nocardioides terrae]
MPSHLPLPKQIKDLFEGVLGRDVTLSPSAPFAPGPKAPASVAVYVDDALRITGLIVCDLRVSAYAGGALGLVPLGGADAAVEAGALTETLAENLYEVLNIAASMFNEPGADHLRLHELHPAGVPLPPLVRAQTLTLGRREDVSIDIAGYGAGQLSVVMVA